MKIGLAGLDTSHVIHFTRLLNDEQSEFYHRKARIVAAYMGGSKAIPSSAAQVLKYSKVLVEEFSIPLMESLEEAAAGCDAFIIASIDAAQHLPQLQRIARKGLPIFIDKPFAYSKAEAVEMLAVAKAAGAPLMTSSALRFEREFTTALEKALAGGAITGCDLYAPTVAIEGGRGLFWYGIHSGEMLFKAMGGGYCGVALDSVGSTDFLRVRFSGDRLGTIRGRRSAHFAFGGTLHTESGPTSFVIPESTPYYLELMKNILDFFETGSHSIPVSETIGLISMLEDAERQRCHLV